VRGLIAGDGGRASWSFVGDSLAERDLRARHVARGADRDRHRERPAKAHRLNSARSSPWPASREARHSSPVGPCDRRRGTCRRGRRSAGRFRRTAGRPRSGWRRRTASVQRRTGPAPPAAARGRPRRTRTGPGRSSRTRRVLHRPINKVCRPGRARCVRRVARPARQRPARPAERLRSGRPRSTEYTYTRTLFGAEPTGTASWLWDETGSRATSQATSWICVTSSPSPATAYLR
jgi:hypothetical protein